MSRTTSLSAAFAIAFVFSGCGGPAKPPKLPTVKVDVKVTVDGQPYGPGILNLSPTTGDSKAPSTSGQIKQDGVVAISSYKDSDGVVPGTYAATLAQDSMAIGRPMPQVKPLTIDVGQQGGAIEVNFVGTGTKPKTTVGKPL